MKQFIKDILIGALVMAFITYGWRGLEVFFYGEIQPRVVDNIIAFILAFSIFLNIDLIKILFDKEYIFIKKEELEK